MSEVTKQWKREGYEEGVEVAKKEIVLSLLKMGVLSKRDIAKATNISEEEVESIMKQNKVKTEKL